MQRRKIRGADIKAEKYVHGIFNAEKCVAYLRGIGVEIDDATADEWLDTQGVFRFIRSEGTPWRTGWAHHCMCGAKEGFSENGRGSKWARWWKRQPRKKSEPCEKCGGHFMSRHRLYDVTRGGSYKDWRRGERWQPIAEFVAEMSAIPEDEPPEPWSAALPGDDNGK